MTPGALHGSLRETSCQAFTRQLKCKPGLDLQPGVRDLVQLRIDLRQRTAMHRGDRHELSFRRALVVLLVDELEVPFLQIEDGDVGCRTGLERPMLGTSEPRWASGSTDRTTSG